MPMACRDEPDSFARFGDPRSDRQENVVGSRKPRFSLARWRLSSGGGRMRKSTHFLFLIGLRLCQGSIPPQKPSGVKNEVAQIAGAPHLTRPGHESVFLFGVSTHSMNCCSIESRAKIECPWELAKAETDQRFGRQSGKRSLGNETEGSCQPRGHAPLKVDVRTD